MKNQKEAILADILFLFGKHFGQQLFILENFSNLLLSYFKVIPRGQKRKREEEDDPQPRRSQRERKRTSFGEDFVELFSPPKNPASSKGSSQSGPSSQSRPSTSSAGGAGVEPEPLPTNHHKQLYFLRKRSHRFSKCPLSVLHKYLHVTHVIKG